MSDDHKFLTRVIVNRVLANLKDRGLFNGIDEQIASEIDDETYNTIREVLCEHLMDRNDDE